MSKATQIQNDFPKKGYPKMEIINNRLRVYRDDFDLFFSQEQTLFFLYHVPELEKGKVRYEAISKFIMSCLFGDLPEEERSFILDISKDIHQVN